MQEEVDKVDIQDQLGVVAEVVEVADKVSSQGGSLLNKYLLNKVSVQDQLSIAETVEETSVKTTRVDLLCKNLLQSAGNF